MKGYYKKPELTQEVFSEDGWFKTGDLGSFDRKGRLSIRGRIKTMILGSSGENIYPKKSNRSSIISVLSMNPWL